jgi:cytochrome P450
MSFDRLAMTPITLSNGTIIPRGTYICMAAGCMAMDSSFYSSPQEFLPERFHKAPGGNLDFVGTESGNVHWGSGRFTCPGRWYASAVMKVFIALIVSKYDVRFPKGQVNRLPNVYMDILVEPNPKQKVVVKKR